MFVSLLPLLYLCSTANTLCTLGLVLCVVGRSENQKNQKINNGECFFCVLVYKEQGNLQRV